MAKRHSAAAIRLVALGEPLPCKVCEAAHHDYQLTMFPMSWTARCGGCGLITRCELASSPAPAKRKAAGTPPPDNMGWPPLWY